MIISAISHFSVRGNLYMNESILGVPVLILGWYVLLILWTFGLIILCYKKGETPKRQWGNKPVRK